MHYHHFHNLNQLPYLRMSIDTDIDLTRKRLLADKRQLQAIITNPNTSVRDKLDAINSNIALNITLMKLEVAYSSKIIFVRML
jgi:hypothetical protein